MDYLFLTLQLFSLLGKRYTPDLNSDKLNIFALRSLCKLIPIHNKEYPENYKDDTVNVS